jgi:hypothetical protein
MEDKFVCPYGLICCDCLFYKSEIYDTARKLRNVIKDSQLDIFLNKITKNEGWEPIAKHLSKDGAEIAKYFEAFKKLPNFLYVLDGLIQLQCKKTCREAGGCSMGEVTHRCEAVKCVKSRGYDGCWQCSEFESCEKLNFLKRGYGKTIEDNLSTIKKKGIGAIKSRENKYYAWQRK